MVDEVHMSTRNLIGFSINLLLLLILDSPGVPKLISRNPFCLILFPTIPVVSDPWKDNLSVRVLKVFWQNPFQRSCNPRRGHDSQFGNPWTSPSNITTYRHKSIFYLTVEPPRLNSNCLPGDSKVHAIIFLSIQLSVYIPGGGGGGGEGGLRGCAAQIGCFFGLSSLPMAPFLFENWFRYRSRFCKIHNFQWIFPLVYLKVVKMYSCMPIYMVKSTDV